MVATRTRRAITTMKKMTHQTACASHPIPDGVGLCQKEHAVHTDSVAAGQWATDVCGTHKPPTRTKSSAHDKHTVPSHAKHSTPVLLHRPHILSCW